MKGFSKVGGLAWAGALERGGGAFGFTVDSMVVARRRPRRMKMSTGEVEEGVRTDGTDEF